MNEDVMRKSYRELNEDEKTQMATVKFQAEALHKTILEIGASRELSLALTNLEQAVMWAVKHITR